MEKIRSELNVEVGKNGSIIKPNSISNKLMKNINLNNRDILIGFLALTFLFIISFFYLAYNGYFTPSVDQDVNLPLNNSVKVNNNYSFQPMTTNDYKMDFYPNYTINLYIDKELFNISN